MSLHNIICLICLITSIHTSLSDTPTPEDTFHTLFNWQPYSPALEIPRRHNKPIMLVFYGDSCFASSRFKKQISNSEQIIQLSDLFTMVKIERKQDPGLSRYRKNGIYYPRVYFIGTTGALLQGVNGPDSEHKYYFATAAELLEAMNTVLTLCQNQQEMFEVFHEDF